MTNQASEDELDKLIEERVKIASTKTKSGDEVVHIAWLADGIDLWNRSNGKFGHSPEDARRYIISSVTRLIRTEKLKLLAEVRERVVGEDDETIKTPLVTKRLQIIDRNMLRLEQREQLTKLEAEL